MSSIRRLSPQLIALARPAQPYPPQHFVPQFVNGFWRDPKFSLRRQADMRKACLMLDVDPASIGMPTPSPRGTLRKKPFKLHKYERTFPERKAKIENAMVNMPDRIAKWREDQRVEKAKAKSNLPF